MAEREYTPPTVASNDIHQACRGTVLEQNNNVQWKRTGTVEGCEDYVIHEAAFPSLPPSRPLLYSLLLDAR